MYLKVGTPCSHGLLGVGQRAGGGGRSGTGVGFEGAQGLQGKEKLSVGFSTLSVVSQRLALVVGPGRGGWHGGWLGPKPAALLPAARGVPAEHLLNYRRADP